jgi:hypothetical protein
MFPLNFIQLNDSSTIKYVGYVGITAEDQSKVYTTMPLLAYSGDNDIIGPPMAYPQSFSVLLPTLNQLLTGFGSSF